MLRPRRGRGAATRVVRVDRQRLRARRRGLRLDRRARARRDERARRRRCRRRRDRRPPRPAALGQHDRRVRRDATTSRPPRAAAHRHGRCARGCRAEKGVAVAVLGYPENGPYDVEPPSASAARSSTVGRDAYGKFPITREVTTIRAPSSARQLGRAGRRRRRAACARPSSRSGPARSGGYGVPTRSSTRRSTRGRRTTRRSTAALRQPLSSSSSAAERLLERRDHVDPGRDLARRVRAARVPARARPPARPRPHPQSRSQHVVGNARSPAPRCAAATPSRGSAAARRRRAAGSGLDPPSRSRKRSRCERSNSACVIANRAPASTLRSNRSSSRSRSSADGFTATPTKNDVGASIALPDVVDALVQPRSGSGRARSSPPRRRRATPGSRRRAAGRPSPRGCSGHPRRARRAARPSRPITVVSRGVTCGIVSIPASRSIATDAISAFIRARAIGLSFTSTNPTRPTRAARARPRPAPCWCRPSAGRARRRPPTRPRAARAPAPSPARSGRGAAPARRRPARTATRGGRSRRRASRIASICAGVVPQHPPDDPGAERDGLRRELAEVLGCRVRVDDPAAGDRRQTDVRHRRQRQPVTLHRRERRAAPRAARRRGSCRPRRRPARRAARPRLRASTPPPAIAVLVERQHRDDRQRRHRLHRLDRDDELVDVEERLDREQVDAAILEHPRLLRVERPVRGRVEAPPARRAGRSSRRRRRPGPTTSRASRASRTRGRVDLDRARPRARASPACGGWRRTCSSRSARRRRGCSSRAPRRRSPARADSPPPGSAAAALRRRSARPCRRRRRSAAPAVARRSRNRDAMRAAYGVKQSTRAVNPPRVIGQPAPRVDTQFTTLTERDGAADAER